jgi:hypothetical protein
MALPVDPHVRKLHALEQKAPSVRAPGRCRRPLYHFWGLPCGPEGCTHSGVSPLALTAVGCAFMARDGTDLSSTSQQQNAHVTESRVLLYRWHPWHGRSVFIFGAVTKGEQAVFRCALEPADLARPLDVPQWMFDAAACCRLVLAAAPSVGVEVLRELDQLISAVSLPSGPEVLQAEHLSLPDSGGACARRKRSTIARSADAVSSAAGNAAVGEPSCRGSRADAAAPGAAAPGTSPPSALLAPRRTGGGR